MAYQGVQDSIWLHDPERRTFKQHNDIRKAINSGQMNSEITQAVNRVHCRKVIDDEGNCPKTDIFILLPTPAEAETILSGIINEMPGINVVEWDYRHQKQGKRGKKVNRGNFDESLIAYLGGLNVGDRFAASTVRKALHIKETTWERIAKRLNAKSLDDSMYLALQKMGVNYQVENRRAFFIKSET
jgi:hypothetical protein